MIKYACLFVLAVSAAAAPTLADRIAAHPKGPALAPGQEMGAEVSFLNGNLVLKGFLYKPNGNGPFPALIWNHGSEQKPGWQPELAAFYNSKGFVFFMPHRHGHGRSPGEYIVDINNKLFAKYKDHEEHAWKEMIPLHDVYNTDVAAAVAWLQTQPFVDKSRIVMSGVSYGGIQTLVSAEKIPGIRGFISFAPAAMSWKVIPLRERLLKAVANAKAPIFLLQAQNDYSTGPSELLGAAIRKKGAPNRAKLYPAFGADDDHQKGHGAFACWDIGTEIWGADVMEFIKGL